MPDVLRGAQLPRLANTPQGVRSDGPDATELAAIAGLVLDPWQSYAMDAFLQIDANGDWVTRDGVLVVPRQNGKGALLEAWALHRLFLKGSAGVLHTAHHAGTASDAFKKMRLRIERSEWLTARLAKDRSDGIRTANGEWGFTFNTGQQLLYKTRTTGAARGLTVDDLIIDEVQHLTDLELDALSSIVSTKRYGQTIMTGSAPVPGGSDVLRRLIVAGRAGDPTLTYLEWSVDEQGWGSFDLDDPRLWAQANPAYGIRLFDPAFKSDRMKQSEEGFAREHLGIVEAEASGVFPSGSWDSLLDDTSSIDGSATYALAVADDRSWAAVGAAGSNRQGLTHVEVGSYRQQTGWVVGFLADLASRRKIRVAVRHGSQAGSLIPALEAARVPVMTVSQSEYAQACGDFFDSVVDRRDVRHLGQPALEIAVHSARTRRSADAMTWDQRNPATDISPLEAVTLAAWGFRHKKQRTGSFIAF